MFLNESPARRRAKPVHVSFVIDRLSRAGTESQLLALLKHVDRDRVQPSLCLLNGDDAESQSLLPGDCPVLSLGLRKLLGSRAVPAAARLASFWRRNHVDVVQTYFLDSSYFAAPLARLCGIHHVIRVRNNLGYWLTPRHRLLGRVVGRLGTTLTNSEDGRHSLVQSERLTANRLAVIENGVDIDRFPLTHPPATQRPDVRVGAVANLRVVKNIDGLIRVAAAIVRDHPRARFEIAGEGDQRPALEEQIRAAGLDHQFHLRGIVDNIPAFLARLDVAVLGSHSESMSNALLEYMAGRAIVATNVGANRRLIRNEQEGLIVAAGDEAAMESAIRRYLNDGGVAVRLANAARHRAATHFSRTAMVRRFEAFYDSLMRTGIRRGDRAMFTTARALDS
jgi:glycosyltransferase involved in cell wall biosynthesis